jgi:mRNA interferase MazF
MVTPLQGEVWWAQMRVPHGSEPGYRRPVVVVQGDALNRSGIDTVVCVPVTSNRKWEIAPGNVLLSASASGLPKPSVANASQLVALNKSRLTERAGKLPQRVFDQVSAGIDVILGR